MSHFLGIDLIILLWHRNVSIKLEPFIILKAMVPQRSFTSDIPVSATRASGQSMGTLRNKPLLWPGIWETAAIGLSGGYLASLWKRMANAVKLAVNFPGGKAPLYCISLLGNLKYLKCGFQNYFPHSSCWIQLIKWAQRKKKMSPIYKEKWKLFSVVRKFLSDTPTIINPIYAYRDCYKRCDYTVDELCCFASQGNIKIKFTTSHTLFHTLWFII